MSTMHFREGRGVRNLQERLSLRWSAFTGYCAVSSLSGQISGKHTRQQERVSFRAQDVCRCSVRPRLQLQTHSWKATRAACSPRSEYFGRKAPEAALQQLGGRCLPVSSFSVQRRICWFTAEHHCVRGCIFVWLVRNCPNHKGISDPSNFATCVNFV